MSEKTPPKPGEGMTIANFFETVHQDHICEARRRSDVKSGENAASAYEIAGPGWLQSITFQHGALKHAGSNGVTMEALLAICMDRLTFFQATEFASPYNDEAFGHIQQALRALDNRIKDRVDRGVHGTYSK